MVERSGKLCITTQCVVFTVICAREIYGNYHVFCTNLTISPALTTSSIITTLLTDSAPSVIARTALGTLHKASRCSYGIGLAR